MFRFLDTTAHELQAGDVCDFGTINRVISHGLMVEVRVTVGLTTAAILLWGDELVEGVMRPLTESELADLSALVASA